MKTKTWMAGYKPQSEKNEEGRPKYEIYTGAFEKLVNTLSLREIEEHKKRVIAGRFINYCPSPEYGRARTEFLRKNNRFGNKPKRQQYGDKTKK